jgi:hypothetical protein
MTEKREGKQTMTRLEIELSTSIPWGRVNFEPRGFISTNMVDIDWNMFHAKYLSLTSFGFSQEAFLIFYFIFI